MTLYTSTPARVKNLHSRYRVRPLVGQLVMDSIIKAGGTIRHRWPKPCTGRLTVIIGGRA